jgi:hypothetical protein
MTPLRKRRIRRTLLCTVLAGIAGCGGEDFDNTPRSAVALQLTGVIQEKAVSVQPDRAGAGPFEITITNQTDESRAVVLDGAQVETRVGAIQPRDTATIQKTLEPGTYRVRAGSEDDPRSSTIEPAKLVVGPARPGSGRDVLLP